MNALTNSVLGFLSLIQPSPEILTSWRGTLTLDRVLVVGSLVSSIVWWRYQRNYCIELQKQYSQLLDRCTGLENNFKKLQKTGVEALTQQNTAIETLSKSFTKQIDALAKSVKQNTDLTTILTSSAAKHETELGLLMQIRTQLLKIAENQNAQIHELRSQIQKITSSNTASSSPKQQKGASKATKASVVAEEHQASFPLYSEPFDQSAKTSEFASRLNLLSFSAKTTGFGGPLNLGQNTMAFSGNGIFSFNPKPNNSSTN